MTNQLNVKHRYSRLVSLSFSLAIAFGLLSCGARIEKAEETPFKGNVFGFEQTSQTTIETTLRYRQIYLKRPGSDQRVIIVGTGDQQMDVFPVNKSILSNTRYLIIDTIARTQDKLLPTQVDNTLYLDPAVFSASDYDLIVEFIQSNYSQPLDNNKLIHWLNSAVIGWDEKSFPITIYAVIHQKLDTFELEYFAPVGKDYIRVKINNQVFVSRDEGDLGIAGDFDYWLRHDTLFYASFADTTQMKRLLTFKQKDGTSFGSRVKVVMPY